MKRCLYVLNVLTMIWSLAACGKAVSSPRALSETEEIHLGYVDENSAIEIVDTEKITVRPDKINVVLPRVPICLNGRLLRPNLFTQHSWRATGII